MKQDRLKRHGQVGTNNKTEMVFIPAGDQSPGNYRGFRR